MASNARKLALVTGGNKGIGYAICKQLLATQNFNVLLATRNLENGKNALTKLQQDIPDFVTNDNIDLLELDVSNKSSIESSLDYLTNEKKITNLDVLVNNAGIASGDEFYSALVDQVFDTNLYGAINATETYLPLLQQANGGRVLYMGSRVGAITKVKNDALKQELDSDSLTYDRLIEIAKKFQKDVANMEEKYADKIESDGKVIPKDIVSEYGWWNSAYGMSKLFLNQYTRILSRDIDRTSNVWVGCYCPGFVATDMTAAYGSRVPLGPDDGANGMVTLCNDVDNEYEKGKFWALENGDLSVVDWLRCRIPRKRKEAV